MTKECTKWMVFYAEESELYSSFTTEIPPLRLAPRPVAVCKVIPLGAAVTVTPWGLAGYDRDLW